jgi:sn-glycerol 3-phosphate transport system substrate-binding protein
VHIDNVSSLSGVLVMNVKGRLSFNGLPQVKHVAMMATWSKAGYYQNFGRRDEASVKFRNGECAMLTTDSREAVNCRDARGVELGVALLPFHDDVYGGRQHTLADGASLWAGAGHPSSHYRQAAGFVAWLLTSEMQTELVRSFGSLPLTAAARAAAQHSKLLKNEDQTLQLAYESIGSAVTRKENRRRTR